MNVDSHFVIGSDHHRHGKPCQDYALAGVLRGGAAYAVVSDGCSTGGRTDIGSRTLCLATAQAITDHWSLNGSALAGGADKQIALEQRIKLAATQATLGCTDEDMMATCLYAYLAPDGGYIHVRGDGVVAWRRRDGQLTVIRFDWARNAPAYPVYASDGFEQFIAFHGGDVTAPLLTAHTWETDADGRLRPAGRQKYSLAEGIEGIRLPLLVPDLQTVALFSDGVEQVAGMSFTAAASELLGFKNTTGDFAKRRMNRFIRDVQHNGGPFDDLSYAVVDLSHSEEEAA